MVDSRRCNDSDRACEKLDDLTILYPVPIKVYLNDSDDAGPCYQSVAELLGAIGDAEKVIVDVSYDEWGACLARRGGMPVGYSRSDLKLLGRILDGLVNVFRRLRVDARSLESCSAAMKSHGIVDPGVLSDIAGVIWGADRSAKASLSKSVELLEDQGKRLSVAAISVMLIHCDGTQTPIYILLTRVRL